MRLTWHIIWKDLRSERWMLLVWALLFAAQAALGFVVSGLEVDSALIDSLKIGNSLLVGLQFATGYVLVVQLVQADAIAGTRMFWLTRPISPGRLLQAKAATALLVFALVPALLLLPWWLYNGFTARDVAWSAVELLGWQLLVIAPAFLIASLTDDLGRAILWGLVLLAALVAGVVVLRSNVANSVKLAADVISGDVNGYGGLLFTKLWLCGFLLVAVSAALATHQFLTRRVIRFVAIAVPAVAAMLAAGRFWPWDCSILFTQLNDPEPVVETTDTALAGLHVSLPPAEVQGPVVDGYKTPHTWVEQVMELRGMPEELTVTLAQVRQTWQWPTAWGPRYHQMSMYFWTEPSLRHALGLAPAQEDPETTRWLNERYAERRARGLPVWMGFAVWGKPTWDRTMLVGRTAMQDSMLSRLRSQSPAGVARVELHVARPDILFEMPLAEDSHWSGRSMGFQVGEWIKRDDDRVIFQMLAATPTVRKNGLWLADAMEPPRRRNEIREFLALNRHNNSLTWTSGTGDMAKSGRMVIGGVNLDWRSRRVNPARVVRNGQWVMSDPDWQTHTTLVLVEWKRVTRILRELKTDKYEFRIRPSGTDEDAKKMADPI
jgi:hypothetical protein